MRLVQLENKCKAVKSQQNMFALREVSKKSVNC